MKIHFNTRTDARNWKRDHKAKGVIKNISDKPFNGTFNWVLVIPT